MKIRAIDCFCGAGGLSLGLKQAGISVKAAFDHSEEAVETYVSNLGNHALVRSAESVTAEELLEKAGIPRGECDLLAGGPPCQGFSRQRRGSDTDIRNDLVFRYLALIKAIQPRFFLMENVPAMQGLRGRPYLKLLAAETGAMGYHLHINVLNAADYGVPQVRKRLFIVGERTNELLRFSFPAPTHSPSNYLTVRRAIGDLPEPSSESNGHPKIPNHEPGNVSELNRQRISHVPPGGGRAFIPEELRLPCHRVSVEVAGHRNVYGRLPWDRPANTITTKCNSFTRGMFAHPSSNRNITMREAARLQGFPDDFVFEGNRVAVAHQIGNAVPPPLARAIGAEIIRCLKASVKTGR